MSLDRADLAFADGHGLSAVSWSAVFAGATAALAAVVTLDLLGAGFGFSLASPWLETRASLAGFNPVSGAWALAAGAVASAFGGYVAGRLRRRWAGVHPDERHFRDTAHGLLVWGVSTLAGVALTALVLAPYAAALTDTATVIAVGGSPTTVAATSVADAVAQAERLRHIAAQASFFGAVGLFLNAFVAAVAAALGGLQRDAAVARDAVV